MSDQRRSSDWKSRLRAKVAAAAAAARRRQAARASASIFALLPSDVLRVSAAAEAAAAGPNLVVCRRQVAPARKLPNLAGIPIVIVTGEASYHAAYDHCTSAYLTQAGVANDHMRLEAKGIHGNGDGMPGEKNNLVIAGAIKDWLRSKGL